MKTGERYAVFFLNKLSQVQFLGEILVRVAELKVAAKNNFLQDSDGAVSLK